MLRLDMETKSLKDCEKRKKKGLIFFDRYDILKKKEILMKGSLNKGFISYLLLFVGLLLACVLIVMTIMIMSPGTSILGYCYVKQTKVYTIDTFNGDDGTNFVDSEGNKIDFASQENQKYIDFSKIDTLNISANYSSVKVRRGNFSRIKVITTVKGFAKAKDAKDIVVNKYYESQSLLSVEVQDQDYLWTVADGRVIEITLTESDYSALEVNILTKNGNISFANDKSKTESESVMVFGGIKAKTENGNIWLSDDVNPNGLLKNLDLNTKKGDISIGNVKKTIVETTPEQNCIPTITLTAENGKITTKDIQADILTLAGDKTKTDIGNIEANKVDFQIKSGIVEIGNITGNLVDSNEVANNVKLDVGDVSGSVVLPNLTDSPLTFGNVGGDVLISTKAGSVNIKKAVKKIDIRTQSGTIDIKVANDENITYLSTKNGAINVMFSDVKEQNDVLSENGQITISYTQNDIFKLIAKAKNINFKSENKTINNQATGYPSISNSEVATSDVVNVETKGDVDVFSVASV